MGKENARHGRRQQWIISPYGVAHQKRLSESWWRTVVRSRALKVVRCNWRLSWHSREDVAISSLGYAKWSTYRVDSNRRLPKRSRSRVEQSSYRIRHRSNVGRLHPTNIRHGANIKRNRWESEDTGVISWKVGRDEKSSEPPQHRREAQDCSENQRTWDVVNLSLNIGFKLSDDYHSWDFFLSINRKYFDCESMFFYAI